MTLQAQIKWVTNIADFKKAIEEGTSGIVAHTAKVDQLTRSLSGNGLLGAANNYVAAVEKMGGVEKLTAAEKDRINGLLVKAIEKYDALGRQAPAALTALAEATKKIEPPTTLAQKAVGLLQSTFGQFTAASLVSAAVQKLAAGVGEFIQAGMKLPAIEQSYQRLTGAMRVNADTMLTNMRAGTRSLVSDLDLMQSANKAMLLGLPITAQSMGDLAKTATTLGKAMGQDATKSLDDLITALGRSSPMILDNLGLTVKVGEANEAYAAKLGKSADQLTQAEQKMAFYQAAMEAARRKTAELGEQSRTLGEIVSSVWTQIGNVVTSSASDFNVGVGRMMSSWSEFTSLVQASISGGGTGAARAIVEAAERARRETEEAARKARMGRDVNLESPEAAMAKLRAEAQRLLVAIKPLTSEQAELARMFDKAGLSATAIADKLKVNEKAVQSLLSPTQTHIAVAKAAVAVSADQQRVLELVAIARKNEADDIRAATDAYVRQQKAIGDWIAKMPTAKLVVDNTSAGVRNLAGAVDQVSASAATYQGNLAGATKETVKASTAWDRTYSALGDVSTILDNMPGQFAEIASVVARTGQAIMKNLADGNVWGAVIAGVTGAIQVISKLWSTAGRDAVKDFAASMGGFDTLHAKLLALGAAGEALWVKLTQGVGRNNPEQAKRVIDEVNQALAGQDAWMQRLPGLIEKYGLSWEQAGQQAKQARLDEIARGLIQDFADLSRAGFDITVITEKMSASIADYVQQAMATGTEVPAAMRPLLEKMIEMGTLTDANGNAITDLENSGITFATTLTQGFQSVVDAIKELTRALGGVPEALDQIPGRKVIDVELRARKTGDWDNGDPTGAESQQPPTFHSGTAKVLPFVVAHNGLMPDEVPAILQTGEAVLNRRAVAAVGSGEISAMNRGDRRGGRPSVNLTVHVNRPMLRDKRAMREMAKEIADHIPSALLASGF